MNRITLMGRIANDLELKTTPGGLAVCSFRMAVDRKYKGKNEEKTTDFFNIVCWRSTAEFVVRNFGKGSLILLEGEMQTRKYTDKNGNNGIKYEVIADSVYFTGEKKNAPNAQQSETESEMPAPDDYPF